MGDLSSDSLHTSSEDEDPYDNSSVSSEEDVKCFRLTVPEHILAYVEKRELVREDQVVQCDSDLVDNVMSNYIIVKKILSNMIWQEKLICKQVSSMWQAAVLALQREQQAPSDCVIDLQHVSLRNAMKLKLSNTLYTEPMVVLTFANVMGFNMTRKCKSITPSLCVPPCDGEHCMIDVLENKVCSPKSCMLGVRSNFVTFMSLPGSPTYVNTTKQHMSIRSNPFIGCIFMPIIPDVEFRPISLKKVADMQNNFYDVVNELSKTHVIKCVLAFVAENFLLHSVEEVVFLNYIKKVQPDIPYALGGCIVEDSIYGQEQIDSIVKCNNDNSEFVSDTLVNVGLFLVRKESNKCNFDSYSLILNSSEWSRVKIQKAINDFSASITHHEHSIAVKLSCVGRDHKHDIELKYFRAAFPNTRIIGAYGNGELGISHPERSLPEPGAKRYRYDPGERFGIMYSYSTIIVYMGWGKVLSTPD